MIREIEFKGVSVESKNTVSGCLIFHPDSKYPLIADLYNEYDDGRPVSNWREIEVYPESVCEFAGFKTQFGVKLFEGDVVRLKQPDRLYFIAFKDGCFGLYHADPSLNKMYWGLISKVFEFGWDIEIVGTIYENPELLVNKI